MSKLGEDLIEGMKNALAYAKGETVPGARTTVVDVPTVDVQAVDVHAIRKRLDLIYKIPS